MSYDFTVDWFDRHIQVWRHIFAEVLPDARKILEIGSWEGRSAVWLIEHAFPNGGELYCVDHWLPNPMHQPGTERRFDGNILRARTSFPGVAVHKIKARSLLGLADLLVKGHQGSFDFVYVDAAHDAASVLTDLVLAYQLCRPRGVIVVDDYLFEWGHTKDMSEVPKPAIDAVVNALHGRLEILMYAPLYQLYLVKAE